ncbi:hypothetical protein V1477_003965 [Vespula maculifrons]|uniref:Secreted protein n=1 Tax=Vespula maculifrons TaxID=7453 RepID=A0ABD2CSK2_VESMC
MHRHLIVYLLLTSGHLKAIPVDCMRNVNARAHLRFRLKPSWDKSQEETGRFCTMRREYLQAANNYLKQEIDAIYVCILHIWLCHSEAWIYVIKRRVCETVASSGAKGKTLLFPRNCPAKFSGMQNFIPEILSQNETSRMHHPSVVTLASPRSSKSLLSSRRSWPSLANRDVSRLALRNRESRRLRLVVPVSGPSKSVFDFIANMPRQYFWINAGSNHVLCLP